MVDKNSFHFERRFGETKEELAARLIRAEILEQAAQRIDEFASECASMQATVAYKHSAEAIRKMAQE
jgi:hypothetical protein